MNNDAAGVVIATLRSHLETATAENERLREELTAARAQATVDVAAGNAGARITADAAAALETARKALEADADQFHAVGMFRNEQRVRAALRALDTPAATPGETAAPDPYCSLAKSEIPGFGTNRDKHRCAKLHRDKPLPRSPSRSSK